MIRKICLIALFLTNSVAFGQEACSRTAVINNQKIMVDVNSNIKGEGLRYYLERDPIAKEYLNKYQEANNRRNHFAILGTVGTGLVIGGLLRGEKHKTGIDGRNTLMGLGITTLIVNYLMSKTVEYQNERILQKAIDEYNKRNLPKIYFLPYKGQEFSQFTKPRFESGFFAGLTFSF